MNGYSREDLCHTQKDQLGGDNGVAGYEAADWVEIWIWALGFNVQLG